MVGWYVCSSGRQFVEVCFFYIKCSVRGIFFTSQTSLNTAVNQPHICSTRLTLSKLSQNNGIMWQKYITNIYSGSTYTSSLIPPSKQTDRHTNSITYGFCVIAIHQQFPQIWRIPFLCIICCRVCHSRYPLSTDEHWKMWFHWNAYDPGKFGII